MYGEAPTSRTPRARSALSTVSPPGPPTGTSSVRSSRSGSAWPLTTRSSSATASPSSQPARRTTWMPEESWSNRDAQGHDRRPPTSRAEPAIVPTLRVMATE